MSCECTDTRLVLTQGDDSNALGDSIHIELDTDLDLTGFTARFQIGKLMWDFNDITSKDIYLVITAAESAKLPVGDNWGALKIFDQNGLAKTIIRNIPILVKKKVVDNESRN